MSNLRQTIQNIILAMLLLCMMQGARAEAETGFGKNSSSVAKQAAGEVTIQIFDENSNQIDAISASMGDTVVVSTNNDYTAFSALPWITVEKLGRRIVVPIGIAYPIQVYYTSDWTDVIADNPPVMEGEGTEFSPFRISTPEQLTQFVCGIADGRYQYSHAYLTNDIDMMAHGWCAWDSATPFDGVFDGCSHSIINLNAVKTLESESSAEVGLIHRAYDQAVIRNVSVSGFFDVKFKSANSLYMGGIAGCFTGKNISNVISQVDIYYERERGSLESYKNPNRCEPNDYIGGIVGSGSGLVLNCKVTSDITVLQDDYAKLYVGGAMGWLNSDKANIENIYSEGQSIKTENVFFGDNPDYLFGYSSSGYKYVGGIIGLCSAGNVKHCIVENIEMLLSSKLPGNYGDDIRADVVIGGASQGSKSDLYYINPLITVSGEARTPGSNSTAGSGAAFSGDESVAEWLQANTSVLASTYNYIGIAAAGFSGSYINRPIEPFSGGNGSEANPFLISNANQLRYFSYNVTNKMHYRLTADINLYESDWQPKITLNGVHVDGDYHIINNMHIVPFQYSGFVGAAMNSQFENLGFGTEGEITYNAMLYGTVLGAASNCSLKNIFVAGTPHQNAPYETAGSIVGSMCQNTTLTNCFVLGNSMDEYVFAGDEIMTNCYVKNVPSLQDDERNISGEIVLAPFNLVYGNDGFRKIYNQRLELSDYTDNSFDYVLFGSNENLNVNCGFKGNLICLDAAVSDLILNSEVVQSGNLSCQDLVLGDGCRIGRNGIQNSGDITYVFEPSLWADGTKGWQSVCLPFDATLYSSQAKPLMPFAKKQDGSFTEGQYWLKEFDYADDNTVYFKYPEYSDSHIIKKNTPYIIALPGEKFGDDSLYDPDAINQLCFIGSGPIVSREFDFLTVEGAGDFTMIGSLDKVSVSNSPGEFYQLDSEGSAFVNTSEDMLPNRACLRYDGGTSAPGRLRIADSSIQTSLQAADGKTVYTYTEDGVLHIAGSTSAKVDIYSAVSGALVKTVKLDQGITPVSDLEKGVYIINGKKIVL